MRATLRATILAVLLLAPALATAAAPQARPWSPYTADAEITSVALAADGHLIAAPQAPMTVATTPGTGVIPTTPDPNQRYTDMVLASLETGVLRNETTGTPTVGGVSDFGLVTYGRSMVAVARDGSAVASLGPTPAGNARTPTLFYTRDTGAGWGAPYQRNVTLEGTLAGLAVSDDGRRVLTVAQIDRNVSLHGFAMGNALESAFDLRVPGTVRAVAADGALSRMYLGGQFVEGNDTYAGVVLYPFAQALPLASWFDRSANNTNLSSLAVSRDSQTVVVGGSNNTLKVFRNARAALPEPIVLTTAETATRIVLAEDGARGAAIANKTLYGLALAGEPSIAWNLTLPGDAPRGLATNASGGIIVAAVSGVSGGGVYAYTHEGGEPIFKVLGDARGVAIDAAGNNVAFAMRSQLHAQQLPRAITLDLVGGGKSAPTRTLTIPGSITYEVNVRNEGAAPEIVAFEGGAAPEITVESQPATVLVRPGATSKVTLYVNSTPALVGPRVFNVSARSLTSSAVDNVTLSVEPQPTLDVKLFANQTEFVATPNETATVLVAIVNNGTSDAPVTVRASQQTSSGPAWTLHLPETTFNAVRGTRTSVRVLMTPPADAPNGTASTVTLTLEGAEVFDQVRLNFRINPNLGVDVNATGITKFVEPGKRANYSFTVTNTGSLPRQFEVFYELTATNGRSWAVEMQQSSFGLDAGAKRLVPVTVIAPSDVEPDDKATIRVIARSIPGAPNETAVTDNATLYAIAVAPHPTTTTPTNGVPSVPLLAVIGVVALAAIVLRRRRA